MTIAVDLGRNATKQTKNQLNMKFQLLIKAKISTSKEVSRLKLLRCCIYPAHKCYIYEQDKLCAHLS